MKRFLYIIIMCALLCQLAGCATQSRQTVFAMDTVMDLQVWGADAETAVAQITELLHTNEDLWSATDPDSLLNTTDKTEALMLRALEMSERTGGAFDPQLGAVMECWGFYSKEYRVPTESELADALARKKWDLGAVVKGNTGTLCADSLELLRVDRAILNLGGNIQTYGEKPGAEPWSIGIQNPDGGDYVGVVSVTGTASVVTSGDYQRYFEKDGVRYHHIIDPKTGMPARSGLRSVTVISRDGFTADALSTALFVMGLEDAAAFWQNSNDFEAVFITEDGKVYATEGANLSGCEFEVIRREN